MTQMKEIRPCAEWEEMEPLAQFLGYGSLTEAVNAAEAWEWEHTHFRTYLEALADDVMAAIQNEMEGKQ